MWSLSLMLLLNSLACSFLPQCTGFVSVSSRRTHNIAVRLPIATATTATMTSNMASSVVNGPDVVTDLNKNNSLSASAPLPAWVNLPASVAERFGKDDSMKRVEIIIGRLAMFGAVGLIGTETLTGASFADQFVTLCSTVLSP